MYLLDIALSDFEMSYLEYQNMTISKLNSLYTPNNTLLMSKNLLINTKRSLRRVTFSEHKQIRYFK